MKENVPCGAATGAGTGTGTGTGAVRAVEGLTTRGAMTGSADFTMLGAAEIVGRDLGTVGAVGVVGFVDSGFSAGAFSPAGDDIGVEEAEVLSLDDPEGL